jgi:TrmH family RNA methyltransferase
MFRCFNDFMLSKKKIKLIRLLRQKKYREKYKLFIAEGPKVVNEFLNSNYKVKFLFATKEFSVNAHQRVLVNEVSEKELKMISATQTPNQVLAVFEFPPAIILDLERAKMNLILALDDIRDPGNFGTIVRIADWFGINTIICSETSVDVFNPKVVQASMGSLARVNIHYMNLATVLKKFNTVYAAVLNGKNIYTEKLSASGVILIGNESRGISESMMQFVSHKISIPNFSGKADSLNAAIATAIICSEFRRRRHYQLSDG